MQIKTIEPAAHRRMSWKNGRGWTREIAIFPPNATLSENDFIWRFSSASVGESGPFSRFPGCRRFLTVLDGESIDIQLDDKTNYVDQWTVLEFSGEQSATGHLRAGPITDLNLIFKPEGIRAGFRLSGKSETLKLAKGSHLVFVCNGRIELERAGQLGPLSMAIIDVDAPDSLGLTTLEPDSRYAVISLATSPAPAKER